PGLTELPADLKLLASRNAIELTDRRWRSETDDLLRILIERHGVSPSGKVHPLIVWDAVIAWPRDLFDLVTDPARFLARKALDTHASLARASVFWILSLATALLWQGLMIHFKRVSLFETVTIVARMLIFTFALATSVHVAWRIVGTRLPLVTAFTVTLYQTAV